MEVGEEVKWWKLARVQSVEELIPTPAKNQIEKWTAARIWEEQYKIIEAYLMMDATIEEACMAAWISVPSYYHHKKEHPEFARRMAIAKEYPKVISRAAVMRRIRQGDAKTALEYLKLRDKRYKTDIVEEWEWTTRPVVQFISVASDEWNTTNPDWHPPIEQKSASDWYASLSEAERMTPWENEEEALRNLDYSTFSNE